MNAEAADVRFKDDIHSIHLLKAGQRTCRKIRVSTQESSSAQDPVVKALPEIEKRCAQLFQLFSR
jgi:hypothetical protein